MSESVVAGLEPFIDTIVVCTLTALVMLSTGSLDRGGDGEGADATFDPIPQIQLINVLEDGKPVPTWILGEPRIFSSSSDTTSIDDKTWRNDDSVYVAGHTTRPPRHEAAGLLDLGGKNWRKNTKVFVIAQGGTDANKDTQSTRAKFWGKVIMPKGSSEDFYIRWDTIPSTDKEVSQWRDMAARDQAPALVTGGIYKDYVGATFTAYAINRSLPGWGTWSILLASWLFAISTMISWSYYGEQGIVYLLGNWAVPFYKIIYCALIVVSTTGIVTTTKELGNLTDLGTGIMLWVNIPIMLLFGAVAMHAWHKYFRRVRAGEIKPTKDQ